MFQSLTMKHLLLTVSALALISSAHLNTAEAGRRGKARSGKKIVTKGHVNVPPRLAAKNVDKSVRSAKVPFVRTSATTSSSSSKSATVKATGKSKVCCQKVTDKVTFTSDGRGGSHYTREQSGTSVAKAVHSRVYNRGTFERKANGK